MLFSMSAMSAIEKVTVILQALVLASPQIHEAIRVHSHLDEYSLLVAKGAGQDNILHAGSVLDIEGTVLEKVLDAHR